MNQSIELEMVSLTKSISVASRYLVLTEKLDEIEILLLQMVQALNIKSMSVWDIEGNLLGNVSIDGQGKTTVHYVSDYDGPVGTVNTPPRVRYHQTDNTMEIWHQIHSSTPIGWMKTEIDTQELKNLQRDMLVDRVVSAVLIILVGLLSLFLVLRPPLRSLQQTINFAAQLTQSKGRQLQQSGASKEIMELIEALNLSSNTLHQQTTELQKTNQELIKANQAKSEFLATMSHELRTPLTSLTGSLGLINFMMSEGLTGETKELMDVALRNSDTMLILVNELLDYEKIISGTMIIETRSHDISFLTKQVVEENQGFANVQSVTFNFIEPEEPLFADVQEHRFGQILRNLLSNAAKFSATGSEVDIAVNRENDLVVVSVKDYGIGIQEEFRSKIFEQFTQADSSASRKYAGTGLGLSISKMLIEGMAGTLSFETEVGVGSTFFITLSVT